MFSNSFHLLLLPLIPREDSSSLVYSLGVCSQFGAVGFPSSSPGCMPWLPCCLLLKGALDFLTVTEKKDERGDQ